MFRFACLNGGVENKSKCDMYRSRSDKNKDVKSKRKTKESSSMFKRTKRKSMEGNKRKSKSKTSDQKYPQIGRKCDSKTRKNVPQNGLSQKRRNGHPPIIRIANSQTRLIPTAINTELDIVLSGDEYYIPPIKFNNNESNTTTTVRKNTLETPIKIYRKKNSKIIIRNRNKRKKERADKEREDNKENGNKNEIKNKKRDSKSSRSCQTPSYKIDLDDSSGFSGPKRYCGESPLPAPPPRNASLSNTCSNKSYLLSPSDARSNLYVFPSL